MLFYWGFTVTLSNIFSLFHLLDRKLVALYKKKKAEYDFSLMRNTGYKLRSKIKERL